MEQKILEQVSAEFNLSKRMVERIYSYWLDYIKNTIRNTEYYEGMDQLGFMIPTLGKIYVNKKKVPYILKKKRNGRTKTEENTGKKQLDSNNSK